MSLIQLEPRGAGRGRGRPSKDQPPRRTELYEGSLHVATIIEYPHATKYFATWSTAHRGGPASSYDDALSQIQDVLQE